MQFTRQQGVSMHRHLVLAGGSAHPGDETAEIFIIQEHFLAIEATLDDVVRLEDRYGRQDSKGK